MDFPEKDPERNFNLKYSKLASSPVSKSAPDLIETKKNYRSVTGVKLESKFDSSYSSNTDIAVNRKMRALILVLFSLSTLTCLASFYQLVSTSFEVSEFTNRPDHDTEVHLHSHMDNKITPSCHDHKSDNHAFLSDISSLYKTRLDSFAASLKDLYMDIWISKDAEDLVVETVIMKSISHSFAPATSYDGSSGSASLITSYLSDNKFVVARTADFVSLVARADSNSTFTSNTQPSQSGSDTTTSLFSSTDASSDSGILGTTDASSSSTDLSSSSAAATTDSVSSSFDSSSVSSSSNTFSSTSATDSSDSSSASPSSTSSAASSTDSSSSDSTSRGSSTSTSSSESNTSGTTTTSNGKTYVINKTTTQTMNADQHTLTLTSSSTANPTLSTESDASNKGLSSKNKKIVIGCVVGIVCGILLIAALIFSYFKFYKSKKDERYVNSEGVWVTKNGNPDEKLNTPRANRESIPPAWKFWKNAQNDSGQFDSGKSSRIKSPVLDTHSLEDEDEYVFHNNNGSVSPTNRYTQAEQ